MSDSQRKSAEPFPNFPTPPLPPKVSEISEVPPPPPPPIPANATPEQKAKHKKVIRAYKNMHGDAPIPPLPPKKPLEHIKEMAKKGAVFTYEKRKITAKKAIDIAKKNQSIHISTTHTNSKQPKVLLSKIPIVVEIKVKE